MNIFSAFSDDQTAILGCFAAMACCGLIAALSFRLGPAGQQQKSKQATIPMNSARPSDASKGQERRAA